MGRRWACESCKVVCACYQSVRVGGPFARDLCEKPKSHRPLAGAKPGLTPGGVRILETLVEAQRPLSLADIVKQTGLSHTYCQMIAVELTVLGHLRRTKMPAVRLFKKAGNGSFYVYEVADAF